MQANKNVNTAALLIVVQNTTNLH